MPKNNVLAEQSDPRQVQRVRFKTSTSPYSRGEVAAIPTGRAALLLERRQVDYVDKNNKTIPEKEARRKAGLKAKNEPARRGQQSPPQDKMERSETSVRKNQEQ